MKCKICGCDSDKESLDDEIDFDIIPGQKNWICWKCWFEKSYDSYALRDTIIKDPNKVKSSSNTFIAIEYLLMCRECQHQTGYGYLWFAIQDGREHILSSGHKSVTISEIAWQEDKAMEIIRIDIKFLD